jgi:hypothetical protein
VNLWAALLLAAFCWLWGRNVGRNEIVRGIAPILDALDPVSRPTPEEYGDLLVQAWRVLRRGS